MVFDQMSLPCGLYSCNSEVCSKQASVTCCLLRLLLLFFAFCLVMVFFHVLLRSLLAQCCMERHLQQVCLALYVGTITVALLALSHGTSLTEDAFCP